MDHPEDHGDNARLRPEALQRNVKAGTPGTGGKPGRRRGMVSVNQDARMYAGLFEGNESAVLGLSPGRLGYVYLVRGALMVNQMHAGDALQLQVEKRIVIGGGRGAEVLVFDLPPLE